MPKKSNKKIKYKHTKKESIDFNKIEKKWQKKWEQEKIFQVKEKKSKKKYYVLEMYPYPSASYLHMGHVRNYTIGDIYARFKRMQGFQVLYPIGYDSFGLPAETAAKKQGIHPKKYAEKAIKKIMQYQKSLGNSYDWSRIIASHDPEYYKWNQYFFIKMFEKGLAYRAKSPVNWCEKCKSVLANEEAEGGKCWRCGNEVIKKDLEQWFFKITDYADKLLADLNKINWPEKIKIMQKNWIGKSHGTEIDFETETNTKKQKWPVFTTRPDTIYGVTFMVISAQHPRLMELVTKDNEKNIKEFVKKCKKAKTPKEVESLEKQGVFTGSYAINPLTNEKVPIWAGNFVLADYGSGMVMAVPAHDQRDFEFAKKYKIPIKVVIQPETFELNAEKMIRAYTAEGRLVNSDDFNRWHNKEAIQEITKHLENKKLGRKTMQYKLRDWLISRQRYWGTPIPIIHCEKCGAVPVPEKDLPILLPENINFKSKKNPLNLSEKFVNVKCPKCNSPAKRETDTMGGFMDSSWYFLRYCDPKNKKQAFDNKKVDYWMPVDQYIGGAEHAVMHLIYARFFVKVLKDLKILKGNFDEPFSKLFNQGIVYKDGAKMSKSKGNVVYQTDISEKYGIDTARLFLMFVSSPDKQMEWSDKGVEGAFKIINKLIRLKDKIAKKQDKKHEHEINLTIKNVTKNIRNFEYPKAIISLIEAIDYFSEEISKKNYEILLKLISPFTPHIAEELWSKIGNNKNKKNFISVSEWPQYNESKIDENIEKQKQQIENLVNDINNITKIIKEKQNKQAEKAHIYVLPQEKQVYESEIKKIKKKTNLNIEIYAVNNKNKYDPEKKSSKVKPEKPAIFIE